MVDERNKRGRPPKKPKPPDVSAGFPFKQI
jgi:hypothetical protein